MQYYLDRRIVKIRRMFYLICFAFDPSWLTLRPTRTSTVCVQSQIFPSQLFTLMPAGKSHQQQQKQESSEPF